MTSEERRLLLESWQRLHPHAERLAHVFFERLFALEPDCRQIFAGTSLETQFLQFAHMLTELTVLQVDDPARLVQMAAELGRRHAAYGVRDDHYHAFDAALATMLDSAPASSGTPEVRAAWREAYELIATIMRRAAARPTRLPTPLPFPARGTAAPDDSPSTRND
jgi:hemoglobin-like flavoprotein